MQNEITLPDADRRQLAHERSQKASRALHDAARKARQSVRGQAAWQPAFSRAARGNRTFAIVSLLLICVLPTLVGSLYLGLIAADQFQAEAQFAVKGRELAMTDMLSGGSSSSSSSASSSNSGGGSGGGAVGGSVSGLNALQSAQDALIVTDYVQSRAIVEKLEREIGLRGMYSRPEIDWFWRFHPTSSIEDFVRYWRKRVSIEVAMQGAIITVHVRAFTADDAERIASAIVSSSEELVNSLSNRSRQDALDKAAQEVAGAERRLVETRSRLLELRNREGVIDPKKSSEETAKLLGDLRIERLKLETEQRVMTSRAIASTSSSAQAMRTRVESINEQIATLERSLTGGSATLDPRIAEALTRFDKVKLDQEWAERFYTSAAASLEKARIDQGRQQVYLESFVQPVRPQEAEFPRRLWLTSLIAGGSFLAWFLLNYLRSILRG